MDLGLARWLASLFVAAVLFPHGGQNPQVKPISVGLPKLAWSVQASLPGYEITTNTTKPDGRRYLFAGNPQSGIIVSLTLEKSDKKPNKSEQLQFLLLGAEGHHRQVRFPGAVGGFLFLGPGRRATGFPELKMRNSHEIKISPQACVRVLHLGCRALPH